MICKIAHIEEMFHKISETTDFEKLEDPEGTRLIHFNAFKEAVESGDLVLGTDVQKRVNELCREMKNNVLNELRIEIDERIRKERLEAKIEALKFLKACSLYVPKNWKHHVDLMDSQIKIYSKEASNG